MRRRIVLSLVVLLLLLFSSSVAALGIVPGPAAQLITFPILTHVAPAGLEGGHFIYSDGSAVPVPLARDPGTAGYLAPSASTASLSTGTDRDAPNASDAYEGETSAVTTG